MLGVGIFWRDNKLKAGGCDGNGDKLEVNLHLKCNITVPAQSLESRSGKVYGLRTNDRLGVGSGHAKEECCIFLVGPSFLIGRKNVFFLTTHLIFCHFFS